MSRWSRSLPVLAVVGAILVAGCGGSDYPSKPNDICKKAVEKIKGLQRPKGVSDLHIYFLKSQQILTDEAKQLGTIKPPSDKLAGYRGFLGGLNRELALLRRVTNTVASNPKGALTLLQQQQTGLSQTVSSNAKAAGLTRCAKPS